MEAQDAPGEAQPDPDAELCVLSPQHAVLRQHTPCAARPFRPVHQKPAQRPPEQQENISCTQLNIDMLHKEEKKAQSAALQEQNNLDILENKIHAEIEYRKMQEGANWLECVETTLGCKYKQYISNRLNYNNLDSDYTRTGWPSNTTCNSDGTPIGSIKIT